MDSLLMTLSPNVWEEGDEVQRCKDFHDPKENRGNVMKLQRRRMLSAPSDH
jgi:hypothetical protein